MRVLKQIRLFRFPNFITGFRLFALVLAMSKTSRLFNYSNPLRLRIFVPDAIKFFMELIDASGLKSVIAVLETLMYSSPCRGDRASRVEIGACRICKCRRVSI